MYFQYGLYVAPVILITAIAAWLYLKISGRSDASNNRVLSVGTILALSVALLIPALARVFAEKLSLSIILSIAFAFLLCSFILGIGFLTANVMAGKRRVRDDAAPTVLEDIVAELAAGSAADSGAPDNSSVIGENEQEIVDTGRNTDKIGIEAGAISESEIRTLLGSAYDYKIHGDPGKAVACYREILERNPGKALAEQIIIDICAVSKRENNRKAILEILQSEQGNLLDYDIKAEIMNNI